MAILILCWPTNSGSTAISRMADAHQNDRLQARRPQFVGNHLRKTSDIVPETSRAKLAKVGEVFAQLSGFDAGDFGKRFAGDSSEVVIFEPDQAAQIER